MRGPRPEQFLRNIFLLNLGKSILVEGLNGHPGEHAGFVPVVDSNSNAMKPPYVGGEEDLTVTPEYINVNAALGAIVHRYTDAYVPEVARAFYADMGMSPTERVKPLR